MAKARIDALKAPVNLAERMVDVTHCEKRLRAIAVKKKGKKHIEIWLTNIPASVCTAEGIIAEHRNRWCIEVFFKLICPNGRLAKKTISGILFNFCLILYLIYFFYPFKSV